MRWSSILCLGFLLSRAYLNLSGSGKLSWSHPQRHRLTRLLDAELSRVTLRPTQSDSCEDTILALLLYSHWMPHDPYPNPVHSLDSTSRFSEPALWNSMGLAIRWAKLNRLDETAHLPFRTPEMAERASARDVRRFRTALYLVESDQQLVAKSSARFFLCEDFYLD